MYVEAHTKVAVLEAQVLALEEKSRTLEEKSRLTEEHLKAKTVCARNMFTVWYETESKPEGWGRGRLIVRNSVVR